MKIAIKFYLLILAAFVVVSCKQPFTPAVTTVNSNILVIEGMINTGSDSTIINISRTVVIGNKNGTAAEKGATVTVESETNEIYALPEKLQAGKYAAPALGLNSNKKYRLKIRTAKGVNYVSDFVVAKISPPIDNVGYEVTQNGVQLYSSTHDPNNNSKYYKWDYVETYIFKAKYQSFFISNGIKVVDRDMVNNDIYRCWVTRNSNTIYLGSSAKLDQDLITKGILGFIPSTSEKLQEKYSVLVSQTVLTKEAFEFWQDLKKNTENLGSIFDAQPSQLGGNIHNVANPQEPVIGYISAGTTQKLRIYIKVQDLPTWQPDYPFPCEGLDTIYNKDENKFFQSFTLIPVQELLDDSGLKVVGHLGAYKNCVDCTLRGTNKKPAFWQD